MRRSIIERHLYSFRAGSWSATLTKAPAGRSSDLPEEALRGVPEPTPTIDREELDISRFASVRPDDARALLEEHMVFRDALDALTLRTDAGTLSVSGVHTLQLSFSLHEAREETGLYRWLREHPEISA